MDRARNTSNAMARSAEIHDKMENSPTIHQASGVRLSAIAANIRYPDRLDLVLVELAEESVVAGVTTQNAFCAAPVQLTRLHLAQSSVRYFLINTGNANAGTGSQGLADAQQCCQSLAELAGVSVNQVLPFSTGVIGELLPVQRITAGLPKCFETLSGDGWGDAARGIMTTDTRPKLASHQIQLGGTAVNITGIAKGAGMIKPNMATMLAYVFTDLEMTDVQAQQLLKTAVEQSFNRITVDGDTSTNDCCMLAATGAKDCAYGQLGMEDRNRFEQALLDVFQQLAIGLIKDAEGASKFVTIVVEEGASNEECLQVAYTIAESPLVKTAIFAADPNWGRILAAVGRAGLDELDIDKVAIFLGEQLIVMNGAVANRYKEEAGQAEMDKDDIVIRVRLGRGVCAETVWTSDLSHDYVRINAEYRT